MVSKRTVLKHLAAAARNELTELDYPGGSRLSQMARSCRELVVAKDSVFDWRDLRVSADARNRAPASRGASVSRSAIRT